MFILLAAFSTAVSGLSCIFAVVVCAIASVRGDHAQAAESATAAFWFLFAFSLGLNIVLAGHLLMSKEKRP